MGEAMNRPKGGPRYDWCGECNRRVQANRLDSDGVCDACTMQPLRLTAHPTACPACGSTTIDTRIARGWCLAGPGTGQPYCGAWWVLR